jgi:hypothetical protein
MKTTIQTARCAGLTGGLAAACHQPQLTQEK